MRWRTSSPAPKVLTRYDFSMAVFEIYNGKPYDLLTGAELPIPGGTPDRDVEASRRYFGTVPQGVAIIDEAIRRRAVGATAMNDSSSRSHLFIVIYVESLNLATRVARVGRLTVVDLAGSEKADKSKVTGAAFEEMKAINLSLTHMKDVFIALQTKAPHVPYRNCTLTKALAPCVSAGCNVLFLACVSPALESKDETERTLQFANVCKAVALRSQADVPAAKRPRAEDE